MSESIKFFTVGSMVHPYDWELHRINCSDLADYLDPSLHDGFIEYPTLLSVINDYESHEEFAKLVDVCETCNPMG